MSLINNFQGIYGQGENQTLSNTDPLLKPKPQVNPLNTHDNEFVASGNEYLTIYTKFSGVDDGNFQYVQNVGVCVGTQYLTDHHKIPADPQYAKNSNNV
ncbi:MAG: hypothetical protein M3Z01_02050 [Thermoproteota archaeon]|nr:hypothetical protein [Thermoproteota archaeon]